MKKRLLQKSKKRYQLFMRKDSKKKQFVDLESSDNSIDVQIPLSSNKKNYNHESNADDDSGMDQSIQLLNIFQVQKKAKIDKKDTSPSLSSESPLRKIIVERKIPIRQSRLDQFGSFKNGDRVERLEAYKMTNDDDENERVFRIIWKKRKNGFLPKSTFMEYQLLKHYAPAQIIQFWENVWKQARVFIKNNQRKNHIELEQDGVEIVEQQSLNQKEQTPPQQNRDNKEQVQDENINEVEKDKINVMSPVIEKNTTVIEKDQETQRTNENENQKFSHQQELKRLKNSVLEKLKGKRFVDQEDLMNGSQAENAVQDEQMNLEVKDKENEIHSKDTVKGIPTIIDTKRVIQCNQKKITKEVIQISDDEGKQRQNKESKQKGRLDQILTIDGENQKSQNDNAKLATQAIPSNQISNLMTICQKINTQFDKKNSTTTSNQIIKQSKEMIISSSQEKSDIGEITFQSAQIPMTQAFDLGEKQLLEQIE